MTYYTRTSVLGKPPHMEEENNSKVSFNRFQFLFENPLLLQDLLSQEKLIPPNHLDIDWVLHRNRPVVQTVSLIRLQRSYLAARFHVRITSESRVLAMPSNLVSPYNSSNSVDLNDLSDSDAIPQVVEEFLTLSEDRFMLLFHHSDSSWEMIGCLSPMPVIKPEVIDLSSDDEEAVPLQQATSSTIHRPVWTNPDLQYVLNMVDPIIPNYSAHQLLTNPEMSHVLSMVNPAVHSYDAHQSVTAAPLFEIPRFDLSIFNMNESITSEKQLLFQCTVCRREMSTKGSLVQHMKIHDPKYKRKCPDPSCPYVTIYKRNMNRHVEVHHPTFIEGPIYICPTCPKKFRSASSYESHIKKCCGIMMFSCPSCDYVTKYRGNLNIHQRKQHSLSKELPSDRSISITPPTDQSN